MTMTHLQALQVIERHRADRVVISTMTTAGIWPSLSDTGLDFPYLPSSMGQAPGLGLGLALATGRGVFVLNGDGCTLMNLGCLVTLANHPADVYLIILDNGLYEVTGGQVHAGAERTDYCLLALGAGIARAYAFGALEAWQAGAEEALSGPGPVVIWLKVEGRRGQKTPKPHQPMKRQIARLREALGQ